MFASVTPIINPSVRKLCFAPYPLHPKGCPNFGKKPGCPPHAPLLAEAYDLSMPVYAIWTAFDFSGHIAKMKAAHPTWSERQLACCLYWQPRARKNLEAAVKEFIRLNPTLFIRIVRCPEACGVDITGTMAGIGVKLEWPPRTVAYQVALAAYPNPKVVMLRAVI